ncbi:MAG TPA: hypothetical protein VLK65_01885 [Vicinamibacteria bacterium]|nr:hypothetical protein [Vicinamibacteria bacterium]
MTKLTSRHLGMTTLGVWLVLTGILPFLAVGFGGLGLVLNLLAIVAGIFILMGR